MTTKQLSDSLRLIADFYDQHPDMPPPHFSASSLDIYTLDDRGETVRAVRALGTVRKDTSGDDLMTFSRAFGRLSLRVVAQRETVCERRVVGVEEVPEQVIPAHSREIVEWDCHSLFAKEVQG